jgi:hypothetical protein
MEVLNGAFGIFLLMEDSSSTIEWARSEGKGNEKLFILMLSSDSLRYLRPSTDNTQSSIPQSLAKIVSTYFQNKDGTDNVVTDMAPPETINIINYLVKKRVPLHCALQTLCEIIWDSLLLNVNKSLIDNTMWTSLRRNIVRNSGNKTLSEILNDRESRKCLEEYIDACAPASDMACLLSWRDTNKTLTTLDQDCLKKGNSPNNEKNKRSVRKSANNAPIELPVDTSERKDYTDAYDALKVLLTGARILQQRYFSQAQVQEGPASSLAVPSESLRLELASTLQKCTAVRDVYAVELGFAWTCARRLEALLRGIEQETFQHLETLYPEFLESYHYVKLVTESGCRNSKKIQDFKKQVLFLNRIKQGELEGDVIVDPETYTLITPPASELQGELYTKYTSSEISTVPIHDEGCFVMVLKAKLTLGM